MSVKNDSEVSDFIDGQSRWRRDGDSLVADFELKNFAEAMEFVNRVVQMAEAANHHPDIDIRWNKVRLALSTHSEGGITQKDFDLADQIILA